mmetsp:Transcript_1792/g.2496  ORF Transcript_1792/g.2496 Transcript_1792/m.2496 type:complete len:225 (+) Transcript_1792:870-1544(+)
MPCTVCVGSSRLTKTQGRIWAWNWKISGWQCSLSWPRQKQPASRTSGQFWSDTPRSTRGTTSAKLSDRGIWQPSAMTASRQAAALRLPGSGLTMSWPKICMAGLNTCFMGRFRASESRQVWAMPHTPDAIFWGESSSSSASLSSASSSWNMGSLANSSPAADPLEVAMRLVRASSRAGTSALLASWRGLASASVLRTRAAESLTCRSRPSHSSTPRQKDTVSCM